MFTEPRFTDDTAARKHLESIRWPLGPVCPHCGCMERNSKITAKTKNGARPGLYFCGDCREQFTVTVGTVFERSKIPLHKWLLANHLMCASKKGISALQLHRMLGITYKSAWFMAHRLREAMKDDTSGPLGGEDKPVEVDETYWGTNELRRGRAKTRGTGGKMKVVSLVERDGKKRSYRVARVNERTLRPILQSQLHQDTHLMTDEATVYKPIGKSFKQHSAVNHGAGEYVRGNATTNTVESSFAILKRGLYGTFHNVSEAHLQRYATEFDFRWNFREKRVKVDGKWTKVGYNDAERADASLKGISGKRLTYRRTHE